MQHEAPDHALDALGPAGIPGPAEVAAAADRVAGHVRRTPVLELSGEDLTGVAGAGGSVHLKLDLLQPTGSFKVRGAFNWLLGGTVGPAGVVAASGGNFGLAVAYAARTLGVPATVVLPEVTSEAKRARLAEVGADITIVPGVYADALDHSRKLAGESGAALGHAYDHPDVVAGQGTCAHELVDQVDGGIDTVLVAVGGGGLIGGIAARLSDLVRDGAVRVVGVEPQLIPTMHNALAVGGPVDVEPSGIGADSLGASRVGRVPFAIARERVDRVVLVTDDEIRSAQLDLWQRCRLLAEPSGAAAWAALLSGRYTAAAPDERVAVIICGANTDPATFGQ